LGRYYEVRYEGEFYQYMHFKKYPLDTQTMKVSFEDNLWPRKILKYVSDPTVSASGTGASGVNAKAQLTGWGIFLKWRCMEAIDIG
jgi:hypothetical protein